MKGRNLFSPAVCLSAAALLALLLTGCGGPKQYQVTWFDMFDTVIRVTAYCDSDEEWQQQSQALHDDLMHYHQLFDIYNHYDGVVNLADVNEAAGKGPVKVDGDVLDLLTMGQQMYAETDGCCNIAAGAVLDLWHDARETETLPDSAKLQVAAAHCRMEDLVVDQNAGTVELTDPKMQLDAGSIAKGWAIEKTARAAEERGLTNALIDAGSNIRAIGTHADGKSWVAGVTAPWDEGGSDMIQVPLADGQSLVTSADDQRYFTVDGVRYSHLIDLGTLYPATYFREVSVLCRDSGVGDALSTGLFCMPLDDGQSLVEQLDGVEAVWYGADGEMVTRTDGFPQ